MKINVFVQHDVMMKCWVMDRLQKVRSYEELMYFCKYVHARIYLHYDHDGGVLFITQQFRKTPEGVWDAGCIWNTIHTSEEEIKKYTLKKIKMKKEEQR